MRPLASVGVFVEAEPGRYALTPIGARLCSAAPAGGVRHAGVRLLRKARRGRRAVRPRDAERLGHGGQGVIANYDFSGARLILDVGGGNGSFVRAILRQQPQARGIICDLPYIESQAVTNIRDEGQGDRCRART